MPHLPPAEGPRSETPAPPNATPVPPGTPPQAVPGWPSWRRLLADGAVALAALAFVTLAGLTGFRAAKARPKPGRVVAALRAVEPPAEPELLPPPASPPPPCFRWRGHRASAPPGRAPRPGGWSRPPAP